MGAAIDEVVEEHEAKIAATQFVDIGEGERHAHVNGWVVPILDDTVEFTAGIAGRHLDFV